MSIHSEAGSADRTAKSCAGAPGVRLRAGGRLRRSGVILVSCEPKLFKVVSIGGKSEVWLMGQRILG